MSVSQSVDEPPFASCIGNNIFLSSSTLLFIFLTSFICFDFFSRSSFLSILSCSNLASLLALAASFTYLSCRYFKSFLISSISSFLFSCWTYILLNASFKFSSSLFNLSFSSSFCFFSFLPFFTSSIVIIISFCILGSPLLNPNSSNILNFASTSFLSLTFHIFLYISLSVSALLLLPISFSLSIFSFEFSILGGYSRPTHFLQE